MDVYPPGGRSYKTYTTLVGQYFTDHGKLKC